MRPRDWALNAGRRMWHRHPGVRTGDQLTLGERAADRLRNGMGSWLFVVGSLVFLAGWMLGNRSTGFDPYPFILLDLLLSCVAALQGRFCSSRPDAPTRSPPNSPSTTTRSTSAPCS